MAEGWTIGGVPLETIARTIDSREGWDDTPEVRGEDVTLLGRHGTVFRRKRYGPGRKTITLTLHGTDETGAVPAARSEQRRRYEAALDGVLRLVAHRSAPVLAERTYADGTARRALVECRQALAPVIVNDNVGRVVLELTVPGSFFEDSDATTYRLPATTSATLQRLEAYGLVGQTAPCADPVVVVAGPCTAVTIRDTATGSGWSWAGSLLIGQTLTVDAGAYTAVLDDGTPASVITDLATFDGQILEISPAPSDVRGPSLDVTWAGATSASSIVMTTRRKWLR